MDAAKDTVTSESEVGLQPSTRQLAAQAHRSTPDDEYPICFGSKSEPWELQRMTLGPNPFNFTPRLPTLADIHRRSGELLAYQNQRKAARARATHGEPRSEER